MWQSTSENETFILPHALLVWLPSAPLYRPAPFPIGLLQHPPVHTTLLALTAFPNDTTTATSPYILWAQLLDLVATLQQDANKRMKTGQWCYKATTTSSFSENHKVLRCTVCFVDRWAATSFPAKQFAIDSYSRWCPEKLVHSELSMFRRVQ